MKETRAIKFYLDKSVNKSKKIEIINFLNECKEAQNKLYEYYWSNFKIVIDSKNKIDFNYKGLNYKEISPLLKSHHFQQVNQDVYGSLIAILTKIKQKIKFEYKDDKEKQRIYNYLKGFCFEWDRLEKYVNKQLKEYKKQDGKYYEFLLQVKNTIENKDKFSNIKGIIESEFWYVKENYFKCPNISKCCIWCNTAHTIELKQNSFYDWYFILDSNENISRNPKATRGVFEKITIPIKYSDYHHEILKDKILSNSFKIGTNNQGQIYIMGTYNIEKEYTLNEVKDIVGIDIGLKKLITCSDGEIIEQNPYILNKLNRLIKHQGNRNRLEKHLQKKLNDENYRLGNNHYLKRQQRLTNFVTCDNRYIIKQFLNGRDNDLIIMENLEIGHSSTKTKHANYLLKRLHIQAIKEDVLRYCKEYGINVSLVNPDYTSQCCPKCGFVSKDNRKSQEEFKCIKCNHTDNADHNASINIKNRYYDDRININTPTWRVKEILEQDYIACG